MCKHSFVRLPDLIDEWEFGPHVTLLKEARREDVVGRGEKNTPTKSGETGNESWGFKEEWKNKHSGHRKWQIRL